MSSRPGSILVEVLARAQQEKRVVVTFDKDFGELAFRLGAAAAFGVVLFRINAESPDAAARAAVAAFATRIVVLSKSSWPLIRKKLSEIAAAVEAATAGSYAEVEIPVDPDSGSY